jgi:phage repressor protein C with HTH and peptisase S24 domain
MAEQSVFVPRKSTAFLPVDRRSASGHITAMELHAILDRIEKRLAVVGLTETAASKAAGKSDAIRNIRRAVSRGDRQGVSTATLNALAPVLKTTSVWLFAGAGPEELGQQIERRPAEPSDVVSTSQLVRVYEIGIAEAGSWREVAEFDDEERPSFLEARDEEYPWAEAAAIVVRGDSMNALKPRPILDGDRLVVLKWESLRDRVALRDGMVLVIERTKDEGLSRELSVKQLELYNDRTEFHPRSTNKRHKPIVIPRDFQGEGTVRILALVRRVSNPVIY